VNLWDRLRRKPSMEEALLAGGVPEEDIQRAAHIGGLELLAIDRLLDEAPRNLSQRDIAIEAGLDVDEVSQVWRALGFPHVEPDDPVYTRTDAEMTIMVSSLLDRGLTDADLTLQMARVIGQSLSRVAAAQVTVMMVNKMPRIGNSNTVRVAKANPPIKPPKASEPVSPMKIRAGEAFHHRKPKQAAAADTAIMAISNGSRTS
jgi:hypothetical protein